MQDLLKSIIETDRKARDLEQQAERDMLRSEEEIDQQKTAIYNDYIARAKERVEKNIAVDRENAEAHLTAYTSSVAAAQAQMQERYDANAERWAEEIYQNVIA